MFPNIYHVLYLRMIQLFSFSNYCYQNLVQIVNVELDKIKIWMYANKLSINIDKTFSILFPTDSMILQTSRWCLLG